MGKSLLNSFVAIKEELNAYFRVVKQKDNICDIKCLSYPEQGITHRHIKDLVKLNVLDVYLSAKEIDEMLLKIDIEKPYVIRHKENKMFIKAWNRAGQQSIFHIINPKYPHIFIKCDIFTRTYDPNGFGDVISGFTNTSYEIYADKILYTYEKNH